jgi:hypothetical protein
MGRPRITDVEGRTAVARAGADARSGEGAANDDDRAKSPENPEAVASVATAVRYLLQLLGERAPGNAVEVRVPPYGAVQCLAGPSHTRGTPPNVIETDPTTWILLATGRISWTAARGAVRIRASGSRADLSAHLPLV